MDKFLEWSDLDLHKTTGKENLRCPNCDDVRTNKKDKSLKINHNNGMGKCFYCEVLTFREDDKNDFKAITYDLPIQTWVNYTNIPDGFIKALEERKIKQFAIKDLGVTVEKYYQPKLQKEVNNLVFNYFERDKVVSKKYRGAGKSFTQSAGTKNIFYNINSVIGQDEVYIVEGEFDVLAMWSHGVKNCISVPNGANDNDDYWLNSESYLKEVKKFIIAVDNDEKGNILKDKIAQRLGRYRCEYIEWQTGKDANDCLIKGTLENELKDKKRFPVNGTFTVEDLYDDILDLHKQGLPKTIKVDNDCFKGGENDKDFNDIFSLMRGHVCTVTGIPSHGKSNFTEWYGLNLANDNDLKLSFFSPEHSPMALHQTNFIQKAIGKPFFGNVEGIDRVTEKDIERYKEWANEKIYLTGSDNGKTPDWKWLLEKFEEQMYSFGVDVFFVDAFNKVKLGGGNKKDEIDAVLTDLTSFATRNNVVIVLVAHPTKMQKNEQGLYSPPTLYDVSGSSDFRNQTHDGFCIYRYFDTPEQKGYSRFFNLKTKMSFQGEIGAHFDFEYDVPTGRYYAKGTDVPRFDLTRPREEEQVEMQIKAMTINHDFENEFNTIENTDIPF
jgi:twinkle protein